MLTGELSYFFHFILFFNDCVNRKQICKMKGFPFTDIFIKY